MNGTRTGLNNITVQVYQGLSTTQRFDATGELARAQDITFETQYPGGLHGQATYFIPRDPAAAWPFAGNDRQVLRNGLEVVWEGVIGKVGYLAGAGGTGGRKVYGTGWWGTVAQRRGLNKPWADNRIDEATWAPPAANFDTVRIDQFTVQRNNQLRFLPKGIAQGNAHAMFLLYTVPVGGGSVRRITATTCLVEGGQQWDVGICDMPGVASNLIQRSSSGSGAHDVTLASPVGQLAAFFASRASQTPSEGGAFSGVIASPMIYTELGAINACAIAADIRAAVESINSDESRLASSASLVLEPFVTDGYEMIGPVLRRAAGFGDSGGSPLAAYFDHSESALVPDGKPVLVLEVQPPLDDYDYAVSLDDPNLLPPLEIVKDTDGILNYVVVRYRDELNNRDVYLTPADEATLSDADSISAWGRREHVLEAGQSASATAVALGRRFLAQRKDPRFYVSSPLTVVGYIRGKHGNLVPSSQIRAGRRVRIENFLTDEVGVPDAGLTFLITHTRYTDADEKCAIACGVPDNLAVLLARLAGGVPTEGI